MPWYQVTVAAASVAPSPVSTVHSSSPPNGNNTNDKAITKSSSQIPSRIFGAGKSAMPMDVALMKLIPSLNAFSNGELSADVLSQRLLRALLIKDIASYNGTARNLISVQDVVVPPFPTVVATASDESSSQSTGLSITVDNDTKVSTTNTSSSPIVIQKKTVSFSSIPSISSSPNLSSTLTDLSGSNSTNSSNTKSNSSSNSTTHNGSNTGILPPPSPNSSKKVIVFAQDIHCHREDVFLFSAKDAPQPQQQQPQHPQTMLASSPITSSYMLSSSPATSSMMYHHMPPSPSSSAASQMMASSPSTMKTSPILSLPASLSFTQVSSSSPNVEIYHVSEELSSHLQRDSFSSRTKVHTDKDDAMDVSEEEENVGEENRGWRAEGSAKVVIDRTKRSIVIEQYQCRYFGL